MIKFLSNKKGETLLEILIALTVITMASAAAASAVMSAVQSVSMSRNYLIAQNLADEGIEAVKNVRDTNWMKYPTQKDCWLNLDQTTCSTTSTLTDTAKGYAAAYDLASSRWILTAQTKLNSSPTLAGTDYNYSLKFNKGNKFCYATDGTGSNTSGGSGPCFMLTVASPDTSVPVFYREIRVLSPPTGTSVTIQITVKWYEGTKLQTLTGVETLTNYL